MRTTLKIDDDVLAAAKGLAERDAMSIGEAISTLARRGLEQPAFEAPISRNGVPLIPVKSVGVPVTLELVNRLRDEDA